MRSGRCTRLIIRLLMILVVISVLDVSLYSGSMQQDDLHFSLFEHSPEDSQDSSRSLQDSDIEQDEDFIPYPTLDILHQEISRQPMFEDDQSDVREFTNHKGEPPEHT